MIDDNLDIRDMFAELLKIKNIDVLGTGGDGQDAYELYQKFHPDIVFMDVLMPNFDGFYGLEMIREYDPLAKVVLVTGSTVDKMRLNRSGATQIIEKPAYIEEVLSLAKEITSV